MTPLQLYNIWSFRKELKYVVIAFLVILSLPIIAVFILTNAGIDVVSQKLATVNSQTQAIQIHDPATGNVIKEISPQVTWPMGGVVTLEFGESDWPYQP